MSDAIARSLSDAQIRKARPSDKPFKMTDGGGLFLQVMPNGAKLWRYKFRLNGKEGLFSIGAYPDVSLAAAREAHRDARATVAAGSSPVTARRDQRTADRRADDLARAGLFEAVLASWRETTEPFLSRYTIRQRDNETRRHLLPAFKGRSIDTITRQEVAMLVKRVEVATPETARNLRNILNGVAEHAIGMGLLTANPVPPSTVMRRRVQTSHAAVADDRLPAFLAALASHTSSDPATRAALLLVILTAARKQEVTAARWAEFDLDAGEWLIPADRMKARAAHFVPLPRQAVEVLREVQALGRSDAVVFPNRETPGRTMAEPTLNMLIERIGFRGVTVHGFRSVFSTRYNGLGRNPDVIEACLAHRSMGAVRAAYNRAEYREERRALLQEWADWIDAQRDAGLAEMERAA